MIPSHISAKIMFSAINITWFQNLLTVTKCGVNCIRSVHLAKQFNRTMTWSSIYCIQKKLCWFKTSGTSQPQSNQHNLSCIDWDCSRRRGSRWRWTVQRLNNQQSVVVWWGWWFYRNRRRLHRCHNWKFLNRDITPISTDEIISYKTVYKAVRTS